MATQMLRQTPIQYELKRTNRFTLEFPTELNIESWLVQMVKRPEMKINSVPIDYMNTKFFVAGKYEWGEFEVEFIDPIGPSATQKINEWVHLHAESLTGRMGYALSYCKDLILKSLDPVGVGVEKWVLYQCMIKNVDFGNASYEDDGIKKVKVTLQPNLCELSY